jgi:hypothetical protein
VMWWNRVLRPRFFTSGHPAAEQPEIAVYSKNV